MALTDAQKRKAAFHHEERQTHSDDVLPNHQSDYDPRNPSRAEALGNPLQDTSGPAPLDDTWGK